MQAGSVASDEGSPEVVERPEQPFIQCGSEEEWKGDIAGPMGTGVDARPGHEERQGKQPAADGGSEAEGDPSEGDHVESVRRGEGSSFGWAIVWWSGRRFDDGRQEEGLQRALGVVERDGAHVFLGFVWACTLGDAFEGVGDGVIVEKNACDGEHEPDSSTRSSEDGDEESCGGEERFPDGEVGECGHAAVEGGMNPLVIQELKKRLLHGERVRSLRLCVNDRWWKTC